MNTVNFKSEPVAKHKELADSIKESLVVENRTIKEKESHSAYYDNLPEGITKKQVEDLSKYNGRYTSAAHVAVGELAAGIFLADKSNTAPVEAQIGIFGKQDHINMTVEREKTYQNQWAEKEEDKEITKHLVIKSTVTSVTSKGIGLKSIRDSMSEEFTDLFNK